jgi:hypothetical protein
MEAVKTWNKTHNEQAWCIPRKNTSEYLEVRAIMEGKPSPKKEKKTAERRSKAIEKLRGVESETKERNKKRREDEKARREVEKMAFAPVPVRRKVRKVSVKIDV